VRNTLGNQAMSLESLVAHFAAPKTTTPLIVAALAALEELGMLYQEEGQYRIAS
jgi:S-adenosylmethionine:tRNA-ribosyltransferase-isomerase (queuine synthetase)